MSPGPRQKLPASGTIHYSTTTHLRQRYGQKHISVFAGSADYAGTATS